MIRYLLLSFVVLACAAQESHAQRKVSGVFELTGCNAPAWATFALLTEHDDFAAAVDCSKRRGLSWVLLFDPHPYGSPVRAKQTRAKADAAGLTPYILATLYGEEWYEHALHPQGPLPVMSLPIRARIALVKWWVSAQHAEIKRQFPSKPLLWLTSIVNDDPKFGEFYYRPLPAGVDVIALEAYVPQGQTFASSAGMFWNHALTSYAKPFVVIGQGFRGVGDPLWDRGPSDESVNGLAALVHHPRVIAAWVFAHARMWYWPPSMHALADMPQWQQRVETALGVRP